MTTLTVNAGSSSIKMAIFAGKPAPVFTASVLEIGGASELKGPGGAGPVAAPTHLAALERLLAEAEAAGYSLARIAAAGHRVVHGGATLTRTLKVDAGVEAEIERAIPLAPLHNPANLEGIRALGRLAPSLPQVACFDTAFHATNPALATRYALPAAIAGEDIRRYGFHGINYAAVVRKVKELTANQPPNRLLALHLGNGASLCAIRDGQSVATTMGYSPLEGLTMGTRTGSIDGNAVLRLAETYGIERAAHILNRESGLLGLGGSNDMRALHAAGTPEARFAIDHFIYWAVRHAGSMIAAMGGLDAVAFTGGIGENDARVRAGILDGLAFAGALYDDAANQAARPSLHPAGAMPIWIVPADEERQIALEAEAILKGTTP